MKLEKLLKDENIIIFKGENMGLISKVAGHADIGEEIKEIDGYLSSNEEIIQTFKFLRDAIILTNFGIYVIDVESISGKKKEIKFFPKKTIKTIAFETAGTFDIDVDIKIGVDNNYIILEEGKQVKVPISFKVPSSQTKEAKEIIKLVKEYYLI